MLNLSLLLEDSSQRFPDRPAFTFAGDTFTYKQINDEACRVAAALVAGGIEPGDKVALCCPNLPFFPILYYGILKAGAVVVPLSILFKKTEMIYHLSDSRAKAFFCFTGTEELPMGRFGWEAFQEVPACTQFYHIMPEAGAVSPVEGCPTLESFISGHPPVFETILPSAEDTAVLVYTSGTTGMAKGAELTHNNLFTNAVVSSDILATRMEDTQLLVLPLFHIFGMTVMMNAGIYRAAHSVLMSQFNVEGAFTLMKRHGVTVFAAVPTMYWALLNYSRLPAVPETIKKNLRICVSGGASLPVKIMEDFESRFEVPIIEGYGMSEGSPVVTFNQLAVGRKPGSIGTPVWGVEVKVVDDAGEEVPVGKKGELIYRGPNVMKSYFRKPEATTGVLKNGWLYSGDIATKDADGFFYIVDRKKEIIIRGGYNIYPREVEEVIIQHEAVSLVAVIGIPDEKSGEEVKAFVVLNPGFNTKPDELIAWTKERIANYKYPRIVEIIEKMPLSASGKILKKELK